MFDKTFFRFFTGFVLIIAVALGVLLYTSSQTQQQKAVDNVAVPK